MLIIGLKKNQTLFFLAAAKVGGILETAIIPADFIIDNLKIQTNVINGTFRHNVKKILFLGSRTYLSCKR